MKAKPISSVRWPGGKNLATKELASYVDPSYKSFCDITSGGMWVPLYMKQLFPDRNYLLNDINKDLINFVRINQSEPLKLYDRLIDSWKQIDNVSSAKRIFNYSKEILTKEESYFNKAVAFYIVNKLGFSVLMGSTFSVSHYYTLKDTMISRVLPVGGLLQNVRIENEDYAKFLFEDKEDIFIFIDPPYFLADGTHKKNRLYPTTFNHERLNDLLKQTKHKFLLTYDDCLYIRKLYKDYRIEVFYQYYPLSRRYGRQVAIMNY